MEPVEYREYRDALAIPLVQIFSVCVYTNFDDGRPCAIYGLIQATEEGGSTIHLYDRGPEDPETILKHGTLTLIDPEGDALLLGTRAITVDLCLKDKIRDIELVKGKHYLDPMTQGIEDSYDKLMRAVIQGEHGFAYLYYSTFRFATTATVEVSITEKSESSSCAADVYGSIVASYSNSRQYCNSDDELKYLETILFDKRADEPIRMTVGTPVKLLRSVVAMPAYSFIIIKADLFDSQGQFASGLVELPVLDGGYYIKSIPSKDGSIQVRVKFRDAYSKIDEETKLKGCTTIAVPENTQDRETKTVVPSENFEVLPDLPGHQLTSLTFYSPRSARHTQTTSGLKIWGIYLVEVFSVYIGGINREVSALCGTIEVDYGSVPLYIYNKDCNDPEVLAYDGIACIETHTGISNCEFSVDLDLKDPIQNLEVSRGYFSWNAGTLHSFSSISWYNKRVCTVVRGQDGYAALHYMIFDRAVRAIVEVALFFDKFASAATNLYGLLVGRYGGQEYLTDYEKKYYQSILFNRPQNKAVPLITGSRVPLSKSVVAVPINSSLVVEADLRAISIGNSHEEALCDTLEFVINPSCTTCKEIRGFFYCIKVSISFEDP